MIFQQTERLKNLKERIDKLPPQLKKRVISKIYELGGLELLLGSYLQDKFSDFEGEGGGFRSLISNVANAVLSNTIETKLESLEKLVDCLENTKNYGQCAGIYPRRQWEKVLEGIFSSKNIMLIILLLALFGIIFFGGKHGKA